MVFNILTTNVDAHIQNFSFMMEENGAWQLTAKLNNIPFKKTFSKTSEETKKIHKLGGIKMSFEEQKEYIYKYFIPKYLELYS